MSTVSPPLKPVISTPDGLPATTPTAPVQAAAKEAAVAAVVKLNREKRLLDIFLEQVHTIAMSLLIVALIIAGLWFFATMLQQLLMALFLVYLILPVRNWLARFRLSGVLEYALILVGVLVIGWFLATMVKDSAVDFGKKWPYNQKKIGPVTKQVADWIPGAERTLLRA